MRTKQSGISVSKGSGQPPRVGVTLVELLVALVIMSVIAGVATLSLNRMSQALPQPAWQDSLAVARKRSISEARQVIIRITVSDSIRFITVLPDGRVIADPVLGVDPLTGEVSNAAGE